MAVCVAVVTMSLTAASPADAQYFGRNKVQYREFDLEVLKTAHLDSTSMPRSAESIHRRHVDS